MVTLSLVFPPMVTLFQFPIFFPFYLDKNCNQIDKPFDKSIVCQRPETFLSLPPQFIAEPSDKVATQTDSSVTFQCAISTVSDYQVNFSWKLNGIHIEANSQDFSISSEFFSSTLEVQVSNVTEGIYQCVVYNEQLKYNVTSRYGYLTVEGKVQHIRHIGCILNFWLYHCSFIWLMK